MFSFGGLLSESGEGLNTIDAIWSISIDLQNHDLINLGRIAITSRLGLFDSAVFGAFLLQAQETWIPTLSSMLDLTIYRRYETTMKLVRDITPFIWRLLLVVAFSFVIGGHANACIARIDIPDPDAPELYYSIFMAKVESVRWIPSIFSKSDLTPPYEITLSREIVTLHGAAPTETTLEVGPGCGLPVPEVGEIGIFFRKSPFGKVSPLLYGSPGSDEIDRVVLRVRAAEADIEKRMNNKREEGCHRSIHGPHKGHRPTMHCR